MAPKLFWSLAALMASALPSAAAAVLSNVTLFTPSPDFTDPGVLYARAAQLPNGDLLATWENYSPEPPLVYFPIYKSSDGGATWAEIAQVHDTELGLGLRYQPQLYVLPEAVGDFAAGTVLLGGSAIPTDLATTQLELYASTDDGATWAFVSHVAAGGEALPNNGLTPVWEPFLLAHDGKLIYYYSDQRDNATYGQKLVHQTSTDLRAWGPVVDDVAYPTYTDRPGMPTLALLPNGEYIYVYEYGGGPNPTVAGYSFPVFYRKTSDPVTVAAAPHAALVTTDGTVPTGSPYVVWTPAGGPDGTVVVSAGCCSDLYVNKKLGAPDAWERVPSTAAGASYTRSLLVLAEDPATVLIAGAGKLPPSTTNKVQVSTFQIE